MHTDSKKYSPRQIQVLRNPKLFILTTYGNRYWIFMKGRRHMVFGNFFVVPRISTICYTLCLVADWSDSWKFVTNLDNVRTLFYYYLVLIGFTFYKGIVAALGELFRSYFSAEDQPLSTFCLYSMVGVRRVYNFSSILLSCHFTLHQLFPFPLDPLLLGPSHWSTSLFSILSSCFLRT